MTGCLLQPTQSLRSISKGSMARGKPCHLDFFSSVPPLPAEGGLRTAVACLLSGLACCSPGIGMNVAPAETAVALLTTTCLRLLPGPYVPAHMQCNWCTTIHSPASTAWLTMDQPGNRICVIPGIS